MWKDRKQSKKLASGLLVRNKRLFNPLCVMHPPSACISILALLWGDRGKQRVQDVQPETEGGHLTLLPMENLQYTAISVRHAANVELGGGEASTSPLGMKREKSRAMKRRASAGS